MNLDAERVTPLNVFYSYAHEDEALRNEVNKHLSTLRRRGLISEWYDRDIQAGSEWEHEVDIHLEAAQIILLLVSSDFLHSDYCYSVEMNRALQKHRLGEARVIPIILRPVDWEGTPIAPLKVLPSGGLPITSWRNPDEALSDVAKSIRKVIELEGPRLRKKLITNQPKGAIAHVNEAHRMAMSSKSEAPGKIISKDTESNQDAQQICQILNHLADQIGEYDYGTKIQLRSLSDAVTTGSGADIWSAANIYKTIDPDAVVERFRNHRRFVPNFFNRFAEFLLFARNVYLPALLILPVFALLEALRTYDRLMTENHTLGSQPLLLLWMHGFGGLIPSFLTPQSVLEEELIIGLILMLFMALIPQLATMVNRKREQDAQRLREEIINALEEALIYLDSTVEGAQQIQDYKQNSRVE